tara:strand:- start:206 stop:736 length:531 start_codon:yes stop_codon:yes gene_type:complete
MGKLSRDGVASVKRVSRNPSKGPEPYKQRSNIEYQWQYFDLYERELKTDLCWAIDTKNLELLEHAYKEARKLLGVSKGRPKSIPPHIQQYREEVKAHFCLYLSQLLGESYSDIWAGYFVNKNQPKKPQSNIPPQNWVRFLCEKYPEMVKDHLFNVLEADTDGRQLLTALLESADNK